MYNIYIVGLFCMTCARATGRNFIDDNQRAD